VAVQVTLAVGARVVVGQLTAGAGPAGATGSSSTRSPVMVWVPVLVATRL
jgi:hypothetical protein